MSRYRMQQRLLSLGGDFTIEDERSLLAYLRDEEEIVDPDEITYSQQAIDALGSAVGITYGLRHRKITPEHLLLAFLGSEECQALVLLADLGTDMEELRAYMEHFAELMCQHGKEKRIRRLARPSA